MFRNRIHWFRIRIQHLRLVSIRIQVLCGSGFWWPNWKIFTAENKFGTYFLWSKIAIYLSLDLHKGRPSYRRSLKPSKENIQHFKTWNFLNFFYFCVSFGNPGWIRIRNTGSQLSRPCQRSQYSPPFAASITVLIMPPPPLHQLLHPSWAGRLSGPYL